MPFEKTMTKLINSTKVKALVSQPIKQFDIASIANNDGSYSNPSGRPEPDRPTLKEGFSRPSKYFRISTLNCRTLQTASARTELDKLMCVQDIAVSCIQEHRYVHSAKEPEIVSHNLGHTTLFTGSAIRNEAGAAIHGVGICLNSRLLPLLIHIKKRDDRIIEACFKGNPKTTVISCYAPHNGLSDDIASAFYSKLDDVISAVPSHHMLLIGGDMNAQIGAKISLHRVSNRNGLLLTDFKDRHNLVIGNLTFCKPRRKLWTFRSPTGNISQIDFILYRKRWRNSIRNCQAYSTSNPVGSDHRIVSAFVKLSLRSPKISRPKKLYWHSLTIQNQQLSDDVDNEVCGRFSNLPSDEQTYTSFVKIANDVGTELLPSKPKPMTLTRDLPQVELARKATVEASTTNIQQAQKHLKDTFDKQEDIRINQILQHFESPAAPSLMKNAWDLVKTLSGKKSNATTHIEGDDRLKLWKDHFSKLLNADKDNIVDDHSVVEKVFDISTDIPTGPLSQAEVDMAVKAIKNGKAPGLDGLPPEFWKLTKVRKHLRTFCNQTYFGNRPAEWGFSGLIPVPKKGDLRIPDNYRGIALSQIAAKVYNRCILNRIRPVIDKVLRTNQNGFRKGRSTTSHILALRRIVEELRNYNREAIIIFIDFRKAFDSITREKMFQILAAYGIPEEIVDAIKIMYQDTSAKVITPEGISEAFDITTGVLQGDPLAPFLFIICLDYALRSILDTDGFTLVNRKSRRQPAEKISDLDYADDIALLEDTITGAQSLLTRVEKACQAIGLYLNAVKTKYIHLNPTSNVGLSASDKTPIEKVDDFNYLGSYCDTDHDISVRTALAWGALHSLQKVWKSNISRATKIKVFKACVESILLYSSDSWSLNKTRCKKLDGTYTKMLRCIFGIPWQSHTSNATLYGSLPKITDVIQSRRLKLAGHAVRSKEPSGRLLLWQPSGKKRVGRPNTTLKRIIMDETGLDDDIMLTAAMSDRDYWRDNFVLVSPSSG